ncbi:MAG: tRNA uridine-5-carboxymethylaminomethyl(34) synthesis GTPase MnmE [Gemmatimonadota bacterium]|nr:tRNA uridine-5-carboxymethylaminomethyl(34) synthesis GTPase MnmE [Gemmatimonadota bacterium]
MSDNDTIAAIATAPGEGAIGIIRLSGPDAISIGERLFRGKTPLRNLPSRQLSFGHLYLQGRDFDKVLVSVMRAPNSFTGDDTVEFNCHGGPFLLRRIMEAVFQEGGRPAGPGEFTRRAFLNGKIGLSQAEAVSDMITAKSDLSLQSAFFQLRGGFHRRFVKMAESIRQAAMLLEANLDFSEDVEIDVEMIKPPLSQALKHIEELILSYERGKIIREGAVVTLAGQPNMGKSSLLNRLLEEDRAIVTDIPGTTRDTIEEQIDLNGIAVTLVDTAGIRDTDDPVEREGTRRSQQFIDRAAIVLYIVDGSLPPHSQDLDNISRYDQAFLVLNKSDLGIYTGWQSVQSLHPQIILSAKTGDGITSLRDRLRETLLGKSDLPDEIVTKERHVLALQQASTGLSQALKSLEFGNPGEIIALDLRVALDALAAIIGKTTPDDVLDRIFQTFCIGK